MLRNSKVQERHSPTVAAVVVQEGASSLGRSQDHEGAHQGQRQLDHGDLHHGARWCVRVGADVLSWDS